MAAVALGRAVGLAVVVSLGSLTIAGDVFAQERKCPVPKSFYAGEPFLPKTAKAITDGREVVFVAMGGASTFGRAAGDPDLAWPMRLVAALKGRFPAARIKVANLAKPRQSTHEMVSRLEREVRFLKPSFVIWETGTMEAVRGADVEEFREALETGLDLLRAAGIETMVMDMQFSRRTNILINFDPYLTVVREVADAADVPLFHRHEIMRYWAENKMVNLLATSRETRRSVAVHLYDCIGKALADFVMRGVSPRPVAGGGR